MAMNAFDVLKAGQAKKRTNETANDGKSKYKKYEDESRKRRFQEKWCEGRGWLHYDENKQLMFCTWCKENNVSDSNFVKGTSNFKLETVKQHENSKWHMYYVPKYTKSDEQAPAVKCLKQMLKADHDRLQSKFRTAHALAKHGKSFRDFKLICELDRVKGIDVGETYCNNKSATSFVQAIAHVEREKVIKRIKDSKFLSFSCDGTTDFTGEDLECFYVRICTGGRVEDIYIHIGSPESSSSEDIYNYIVSMFEGYGIDMEKIVGFTADGASNMQGKKTGLAARLLERTPHIITTHCVAHRLELAFKDAIKSSTKTLYDRSMTLLLGIYYLYRKSPKLKKQLKRSFAAQNQKPVLPVRVGGTRWLPHMSKALYTFFKGYTAIRNQLESASHSNPKAEGLAKVIGDGNVIVFLLILKEVIFHLMKLSLYLQKESLVLADAFVEIKATESVMRQIGNRPVPEAQCSFESKTYAGQNLVFRGCFDPSTTVTKLTKSISVAVSSRFTESDIVDATAIASFANWPIPSSASIEDFGCAEVDLLCHKFKDVLSSTGVDVEQCGTEWTKLKTKVYKRYSNELQRHTLTWEAVNHGFGDLVNILILMDLVLSLPATSVRNECLFSTMKLVKGKRRGRMTNSTLDDLLLVAVQSPKIAEYNPDDAILHWMSTRGSRRLNYVRKKPEVNSTAAIEGSTASTLEDTLGNENVSASSIHVLDDVTITDGSNVDPVDCDMLFDSASTSTSLINNENVNDDTPAREYENEVYDDSDEESDNEQSELENSAFISKYVREMEMEIEYEFN